MKCEEELDEEDEEDGLIILGETVQIADDFYILIEEEAVGKLHLKAGYSILFFKYMRSINLAAFGVIQPDLEIFSKYGDSSCDDVPWGIKENWKICIYPGPIDPLYRPQDYINVETGEKFLHYPNMLKEIKPKRIHMNLERGEIRPLTEEENAERDRIEKLEELGHFWRNKQEPTWPPIGQTTLQTIGNFSQLLKVPSHAAKILRLKDGCIIGCQWNYWSRESYVNIVTHDSAKRPLEKKTRGSEIIRADSVPHLRLNCQDHTNESDS